jgi:carboxypeptidase PM20D1
MQTLTSVIIIALLAALAVLALVVLARTLALKPPVVNRDAPPYDDGEVPPEALARLAKAISIPTVSAQNYGDTDFSPFDAFIEFLKESYPLFHKTCELARINTYALVYRWQGKDTSLLPLLLTAHYDVVPVEAGTERAWQYPGFSGAIAEGRIWGRGTLDIKSQLTAHLEAAETLMQKGFTPQRDLYFVYGQDEEVGGRNGALQVAAYFAEKGIRLEGVLDEGGFVVSDVIKGVASPLALIGIAEKGFCNYEFTLDGEGGHSSMPPPHTAVGKAAKLICAIENNPLPARLTPPTGQMLRTIAGEMGFVVRMAMANLWLFRPLLLTVLSKNDATNAMVRTTFAATLSRAGDAPNVLPQKAQSTVNVRLLHGDTLESVESYFRKLAGDVPLEVSKTADAEASELSPVDSAVFLRLKNLITEVYPASITTPYLVMGGTDSRKYYTVCDNVYRFTPILVSNEEQNTVHSTNESLTIANYGRMIYFFTRFIEDL